MTALLILLYSSLLVDGGHDLGICNEVDFAVAYVINSRLMNSQIDSIVSLAYPCVFSDCILRPVEGSHGVALNLLETFSPEIKFINFVLIVHYFNLKMAEIHWSESYIESICILIFINTAVIEE